MKKKREQLLAIGTIVGVLCIICTGSWVAYTAMECKAQKQSYYKLEKDIKELQAERVDLSNEDFTALENADLSTKELGKDLLMRLEHFNAEMAKAPASLLDYSFELQATLEELRNRAVEAGVNIDPQEQFGLVLSEIRKEDLNQLNKKLVVLKEVLPKLLRSQPAGIRNIVFNKNGDSFDVSLSFTGYTQALRQFLREIEQLDAPINLVGISAKQTEYEVDPKYFISSVPTNFEIHFEFADGRQSNTCLANNFELAQLKWHAPQAQDRNVFTIYDLFTPPTMYRDERSGIVIAKAHPLVGCKVEYMTARVINKEKLRYRVQLQGWSKRSGSHSIIAMLSCEERSVPLIVKEGDSFLAEGFTVEVCEISETQPNTPYIKIHDHLSGEKICLSDKGTFLSNFEQIVCTEDESTMIVGLYDGERGLFLQEEGTYTVMDFDREKAMLYLKKDAETKDFSGVPPVYLSMLTKIKLNEI